MTRDEAKVLMRTELERDLTMDERAEKFFHFQDKILSSDDLMSEVEAETKLGKALLDDFISFKGGKLDEPMTDQEKTLIMEMMEKDIQTAPPGWADTTIFSIGLEEWTPNKLMEEVRAQTDFGLSYMETYRITTNSRMTIFPSTKKVKNDQSN